MERDLKLDRTEASMFRWTCGVETRTRIQDSVLLSRTADWDGLDIL